MKKTVLILIALMALQGAVYADANSGAYIEKGIGARPLGMGMAFTAVLGDPNLSFWNPAGLSSIKGIMIDTTFYSQFDANYQSIAYAQETEWGIFGASYLGASLGGIHKTDGSGGIVGSDFGYGAYALLLSYGRSFGSLSVGSNIKLLGENLENNSSSGYGVDLGAAYNLSNDIVLGLSIQNLITPQMKWNTASGNVDSVPANLKAGIAGRLLENKLLAAFDMDIKEKRPSIYHLGFEYSVNKIFVVRLGLDDGALAAGTGVKYGGVSVDYSYNKSKYDLLDDVHRISVGYAIEDGWLGGVSSLKDKSVLANNSKAPVIAEPLPEPALPVSAPLAGSPVPLSVASDDVSGHKHLYWNVVEPKDIAIGNKDVFGNYRVKVKKGYTVFNVLEAIKTRDAGFSLPSFTTVMKENPAAGTDPRDLNPGSELVVKPTKKAWVYSVLGL